jgi:hypothetical protein
MEGINEFDTPPAKIFSASAQGIGLAGLAGGKGRETVAYANHVSEQLRK